MQFIDKKLSMPSDVAQWVKKNKPTEWNLSQDYREGYEILREQLREEQYGLCCYCGQILEEVATIEHLHSRNKHSKLTFDYQNLLLSCQVSKQCDNAKGNQVLDLTPLMPECDDEIRLNWAGELIAKTDRAKQAITLLNLNGRKLCGQRQTFLLEMMATLDLAEEDMLAFIKDEKNSSILFEFFEKAEYHRMQYHLKKLQ
ncbi:MULTISPECIES: retron system putative HNH endonuclease [unclassified Acinetobacter]|uniref:retron system putative HNH endonuclease n=1 Tax=unclassified Acinetobacter TaxID=196816 RepID=UPI0035B8BD1D